MLFRRKCTQREDEKGVAERNRTKGESNNWKIKWKIYSDEEVKMANGNPLLLNMESVNFG
jgi:hypothetical protein